MLSNLKFTHLLSDSHGRLRIRRTIFRLPTPNLTFAIQDLGLLWKSLVQDVSITDSPTASPLLWRGLCLGAEAPQTAFRAFPGSALPTAPYRQPLERCTMQIKLSQPLVQLLAKTQFSQQTYKILCPQFQMKILRPTENFYFITWDISYPEYYSFHLVLHMTGFFASFSALLKCHLSNSIPQHRNFNTL